MVVTPQIYYFFCIYYALFYLNLGEFSTMNARVTEPGLVDIVAGRVFGARKNGKVMY